MPLIAITLFTTLMVVAIVHIGWAFGMSWPAKTRAELPAMVVGIPAGSPMPPAALTSAVGLAIFGLGAAALWGAGLISLWRADTYRTWVLAAIAAIFALRGIMTYLPFGPLQASVEPFRSLDRRYFAPLCLLLAAGYFAIFLSL